MNEDISEDWIALFESDFSSRVFLKPGISTDVIYWVKRFHNGKRHNPSTTTSSYALRSFEFYDAQLLSTTISYDTESKWECLNVVENGLDAHGSYCSCLIRDGDGKVNNVYVHGQWQRQYGGFQTSIKQHLYFSAIMFFLRAISKFKNWDDLNKNEPTLLHGEGIPSHIFEKVEKRDNLLKELDIKI